MLNFRRFVTFIEELELQRQDRGEVSKIQLVVWNKVDLKKDSKVLFTENPTHPTHEFKNGGTKKSIKDMSGMLVQVRQPRADAQ